MKYSKRINMKKFYLFFLVLLPNLLLAENGPSVSPDDALNRLREGNERFIAGRNIHPHLDKDRRIETSKDGQKPFATILGCSDSRVPVEQIFDQGVGDLFVVKVAGNVADTDEIGTIEYGTEHLGTSLLVVLGHTKCGAVTAVVTDAKLHGSLPGLVDNIKPAFDKAKHDHPNLVGKELVPSTIKANAFQGIADIISHSTIIAKLLKQGKLKIVAAQYDIETGEIEWLGEHPNQKALIEQAKDPVHGENGEPHETSFFSIPNLIYMLMFLFICAIVVGIILFVAARKVKYASSGDDE